MKKWITKFIFPILVIIVCYWAIRPLVSTLYYPMHDDTAPSRVYEMAKALSFGQFPVRFVPDLGYGYGYPLFNFYAPLPYYIGALIYLLGVNLIDSTKIMIIIGILLSGIAMYYLMKELAGNISGIVGAILYVYAPYHAVNIYVRGAIGELYAYGFLPLIVLGIIKIFKLVNKLEKNINSAFKKGVLIGSIGVAGVLLSHNILGMITGSFLGIGMICYFIYLLIKRQKLSVICYLLFVIFLGVGLSSFFTLPAVFERKYTRAEQLTAGGNDFHRHFVYLDQLWDSPWGFAGSAPGRDDGMSFKIGKFHLIIGLFALLCLSAYSLRRKKSMPGVFFYLVMILLFIISVYLMLQQSQIIWESLSVLAYIQYPWRFLNLALFSLVCVSSIIFLLFTNWYRYLLAVVIIGITLWLNVKYFIPQKYIDKTADDYINEETIRYNISRISDEYLPSNFQTPKSQKEIAFQGLSSDKDLFIDRSWEEPVHKIYQIKVNNPVSIMTNITYFPGWEARLNNQRININDMNGRIGLNLPSGNYTLELALKDTPIRTLGNTLSVFCLILLVYVSLFGSFISYGQKNKS